VRPCEGLHGLTRVVQGMCVYRALNKPCAGRACAVRRRVVAGITRELHFLKF
jgi:hypothetical protein